MALKKIGNFWYGSDDKDLQEEIGSYSKLNGYIATKFLKSVCNNCQSHKFKLESDDNEGCAKSICVFCGKVSFIHDSEEFLEDANLEEHECICEAEEFEIVTGLAFYNDSDDVRWCYVGCRCLKCNLVGVFADWKVP